MYGAKTQAVLVVLQGRDGAGKDGAIKHVAGFLNPRGVAVTSFGLSPNCTGIGGAYRLDQPDDLEFLASFGVTP